MHQSNTHGLNIPCYERAENEQLDNHGTANGPRNDRPKRNLSFNETSAV